MDTLEKFTAALAPVARAYDFEYLTVNRGENIVVMYDTEALVGGDWLAYDEWQQAAVSALAAAGFTMQDSGARGGAEGGYYSVWSAK